MQFLGQDVASTLRMSTKRSIIHIGKDSLTNLRYSLDKYSFDINAEIATPIIILPILKNNDSSSPVWVLRLGDLLVKSTESANSQTVNLTADLTKTNVEVFSFLLCSIIQIGRAHV